MRQVETRNAAEAVLRIIETLPDTQRTVITLKDVEGMSPGEITKETGLSAVNVRVALSRARSKVREVFMRNERKHDEEQ